MTAKNDELEPERLNQLLTTRRWGRSLVVLDSTKSTMDDARRAAATGVPDGHVVLANEQTEGRGAHGRTWTSPPGQDLYLSVVSRPTIPLSSSALMTLAVGLGVRETVAALVPDGQVQIKWPNDIWVEGRKCGGILVEGRATGPNVDAVIIGIGLNINRTQWPPELEGLASSVRVERGDERDLDRGAVFAALLGSVERWVDLLVDEGAEPIVEALGEHLALLGEQVECDGVVGVFDGIAEDGAALVKTDGGVETVRAGRLLRRPI